MELPAFSEKFFALTQESTWEIEGFLDTQRGMFIQLTSDTKVISTVFERLSMLILPKEGGLMWHRGSVL
jgi:hypothetical protein